DVAEEVVRAVELADHLARRGVPEAEVARPRTAFDGAGRDQPPVGGEGDADAEVGPGEALQPPGALAPSRSHSSTSPSLPPVTARLPSAETAGPPIRLPLPVKKRPSFPEATSQNVSVRPTPVRACLPSGRKAVTTAPRLATPLTGARWRRV